MSHYWEHGRTRFVGNSDLSGPITIVNELGERIKVPGRDLLEFVAGHIARERISRLEQELGPEILGISFPGDYALDPEYDKQETVNE